MKIAILSNGPGNYSTKRLREVAKARGHTVLQAFYLTNEDGTNVLLQEFVKESAGTDSRVCCRQPRCGEHAAPELG